MHSKELNLDLSEDVNELVGVDSVELIKDSTIKVVGSGNRVVFLGGGRFVGSKIEIIGDDNVVEIGANCWLRNQRVELSSSQNRVNVGDDCKISGAIIAKISNSAEIQIGSNTTMGGVSIICGEGRRVLIGKDCMFSFGINVRTTDSHAVYDLNTNERVNSAADISVGNHVWVGANSTLLKGSEIADGSVLSMGAVLTAKFTQSNIALAGNPARKVKESIYWDRELLG